MPRATIKKDLLILANEQFEKMWEIIGLLDEEGQDVVFEFSDEAGKEAHWKRDKNMRDIFIHLYEWHQLLLAWVKSNQDGIKKDFLPEQYNWKTYGDMNVEFWKKHQNTSYEKSKEILMESHRKVMELIEVFSDEELFTKKYFTWTGGSSLGQYCISSTASHYDWAIRKIKMYIKSNKK